MGTLNVDKLAKTSTGAAEFTLPAADGTANQVCLLYTSDAADE